MMDLTPLYHLAATVLPLECMQARFMQQAFMALVMLAPMTAAMGVQVINFQMAFFSDAISHSAFAGVALGLIFSVSPLWTMPFFGLLVGLGIMALQRNSELSTDTVIGVFFSAVIAFGLAIVSRDRSAARDVQLFLYGDILTIGDSEILFLMVIFLVQMALQIWGYNRLLYVGLNATLAKAHRIQVALYQYLFAGLLALIVMFSVRAVGVLLVTAMLIVPAASARNLANSAGAMFWWALLVSVTSAVTGLLVSAQPWAGTATGATIILIACGWFGLSVAISFFKSAQPRMSKGPIK
jgi:zinc transport system permease protein